VDNVRKSAAPSCSRCGHSDCAYSRARCLKCNRSRERVPPAIAKSSAPAWRRVAINQIRRFEYFASRHNADRAGLSFRKQRGGAADAERYGSVAQCTSNKWSQKLATRSLIHIWSPLFAFPLHKTIPSLFDLPHRPSSSRRPQISPR
jgi:hypothetical protein